MIHLIDTLFQNDSNVIAAIIVETNDGLVVIDCGPETVYERVAEGVRRVGAQLNDVRHLILTHIHLDHAGASGRWARETGAKVYVHPRGAPHLADPSRLYASAQRIYGDAMDRLWGKVQPVPAEQILVAEDHQILKIGGLEFETLATPGHAQHHNVYRLNDSFFVGDTAGVCVKQGPVIPPCPPPDIDVEAWRGSIQRLRQCQPKTFYLTHFGIVMNPLEILDELDARLVEWAEWIKAKMLAEVPNDLLVKEFEEHVKIELSTFGITSRELDAYELADPAAMSVAGLTRYWRKRGVHDINAPVQK